MNPLTIIRDYYSPQSEAYRYLVIHSEMVTRKALAVAEAHPELRLDRRFIAEAAMLHDIGIFRTNAPSIDCHGTFPYICHGMLGADLLRSISLPRHALVCERHTGTGLTRDDIIRQNLPLPLQDMVPISLEEKVIAYADKFYSKGDLRRKKPLDEIRQGIARFGAESLARWDQWQELFG